MVSLKAFWSASKRVSVAVKSRHVRPRKKNIDEDHAFFYYRFNRLQPNPVSTHAIPLLLANKAIMANSLLSLNISNSVCDEDARPILARREIKNNTIFIALNRYLSVSIVGSTSIGTVVQRCYCRAGLFGSRLELSMHDFNLNTKLINSAPLEASLEFKI